MNSYLDNLVLRTLDLAPVAQPRLTSVFESSVVAGGAAAQAPVQGELSGAEQSRPSDIRGPLAQALHTTIQVVQAQPEMKDVVNSPGTRTGSNVNDSNPVDQREVTPVSRVVASPAAVKGQNQITDVPNTRIEAQTRGVDKETIELSSESKIEKPPLVSDVASIERDGLWRKLEPRVRQVVRDELPAPRSSHEERDHDSTTIEPNVVKLAAPPKYDSIVQSVPARAVVTPPSVTVAPPAPEITVTIGRVDVRAVVSPSAAATRRDSPRSTSPTSLDQYLKQRSEGRR